MASWKFPMLFTGMAVYGSACLFSCIAVYGYVINGHSRDSQQRAWVKPLKGMLWLFMVMSRDSYTIQTIIAPWKFAMLFRGMAVYGSASLLSCIAVYGYVVNRHSRDSLQRAWFTALNYHVMTVYGHIAWLIQDTDCYCVMEISPVFLYGNGCLWLCLFIVMQLTSRGSCGYGYRRLWSCCKWTFASFSASVVSHSR